MSNRNDRADDEIIRMRLSPCRAKRAPVLSAHSAPGVRVASVHVDDGRLQSAVLRAVKGVLAQHLGGHAVGSMTKVELRGPLSAGNGTLNQTLRDVMDVPHVSTGDFLREVVF